MFPLCDLPDMEKFPLRMKDNDLPIAQLLKEPITSLSVYLTPNVCELRIM